MRKIRSVSIAGFRSIGREQTVRLGDVTVCLGANGAGKSNLVSFFRLLNELAAGGLQGYVAKNGMANAILHFGAAVTKTISFEVVFRAGAGAASYRAGLSFGMPDSLFFSGEWAAAPGAAGISLGPAGRPESALGEAAAAAGPAAEICRRARAVLSRCRVFQFHDTSASSRLRNSCYVEDAGALAGDAGNLPAFLHAMRESRPAHYRRIVDHVRAVVPQFRDFRLRPSAANPRNIFLNWAGERGGDYLFGPHQLSDGSLRYMALAALLLQPAETLPDVVVVDEPELGLHPAAIASLAGMVSIAKQNCQVVLATQSPDLANLFPPEDILIADYDGRANESRFRRPDWESLKAWLEDYSVADLWDKNLLGGRP